MLRKNNTGAITRTNSKRNLRRKDFSGFEVNTSLLELMDFIEQEILSFEIPWMLKRNQLFSLWNSSRLLNYWQELKTNEVVIGFFQWIVESFIFNWLEFLSQSSLVELEIDSLLESLASRFNWSFEMVEQAAKMLQISASIQDTQLKHIKKSLLSILLCERNRLGIEKKLGKMLSQVLSNMESIEADTMEIDSDSPQDYKIIKRMISCLKELNLLEMWKESSVVWLNEIINKFISEYCSGVYSESKLDSLLRWFDSAVAPLLMLYESDSKKKILYTNFARLRISELFDIIVEYPESKPALDDLREAVIIADLRKELVDKALSQIKQRLLHPGAKTMDIINQYISTDICLKVIDPAGHILEIVAAPIGQYLRLRDDTVRNIVQKLFSEDSSYELSEDIKNGKPITFDGKDKIIYDDYSECDENETDYLHWIPNPSDIGYGLKLKRQQNDLLTSLVNIYESVSVFVREFQVYMCERLLSRTSFDFDVELGYLEMLKLRFGETEMHNCEVMLKDIQNSSRIDKSIRGLGISPEYFHVFTISYLFWPINENLVKSKPNTALPAALEPMFKRFEKEFESLRRSRRLVWLHMYGKVHLTLSVDGKSSDYTVSPFQAILIHYFLENPEWKVLELSERLGVNSNTLLINANIWTNAGILSFNSTLEILCLKLDEVSNSKETSSAYVGEEPVNDESSMQIFWTFVVGMLTNLGPLSAGRIQTMLTMFVQAPHKYDRSLEELQSLLDQKVKEEMLEIVGTNYKLKH